MRVTNEQVDALLDCTKRQNCEVCKALKSDGFCNVGSPEDYACDLLEARKLIWEMRQGLAYINSLNIDPTTSALLNTVRCGFSSKKAKELLEKSKDYV